MILAGSNAINQSLPKPIADPAAPNSVNLKDVRTLAVNNQVIEKSLTLRLLNSKGVEIARSEIKELKPFYISPNKMIELKGQKFDVTGLQDETKKGVLNMKIKYLQAPEPG